MHSREVLVKQLLESYGYDVDNDTHLSGTPRRYVKFLERFLSPDNFAMTTFDSGGFVGEIRQTNIVFYSLCPHHMLPISGIAEIAYYPSEKIVGLSKLSRVVDHCAAGLKTQEQITKDIANYLNEHLQPRGVYVKTIATHFCMSMRGVKKHNAKTITEFFLGCYNRQNHEKNI